MVWVPYKTILFAYFYKGNERMGIRKYRKKGKGVLKTKGMEGMGIRLAHAQGQVC
jgi:hypothetical protein